MRLPALLVVAPSAVAAAGVNIAVSAVAALTAGVTHARARRVDWGIALWMTPTSIGAAFVGGYFADEVPEQVLLGAIAAVLGWNGFQLLLALGAPSRASRPRLAAALAGGIIGLLGGAVGLILGTLRMPALLGSVGLAAHRAVGTNLVVGFFLGLAGFTGHAARADIDWTLLAVCVAATVPAAWLGARLAGRLSEDALKRAVGAVLIVVAVVIAAEAAF